jgi:hypothetical protein
VPAHRGVNKFIVLAQVVQHPRLGRPRQGGTFHVGEQQHHRLDT